LSGVTSDLFDATAMYEEDYLHFFASPSGSAPTHGPIVGTAFSRTAQAADLVGGLLDLRPGREVLDLACGHGALASELVARGCRRGCCARAAGWRWTSTTCPRS
jgi:cyclopropane fatty-acyl-phospholipid synthase-like methyltransferase